MLPKGNELIERGGTYLIKWKNFEGQENLSLKLFSGDEKIMDIADKVHGSESFEWKVPGELEGNDFYIQIQNESGFISRNIQPFSIVKRFIQPQTPQHVLEKRLSKKD